MKRWDGGDVRHAAPEHSRSIKFNCANEGDYRVIEPTRQSMKTHPVKDRISHAEE